MHCRRFPLTAPGTGTDYATICANPSGSRVAVSINKEREKYPVSAYQNRNTWKMTLQRYENGRWNNVATRTGYVSSESPSNRTFTAIAQRGTMKVLLDIKNGDGSNRRLSTPTWRP